MEPQVREKAGRAEILGKAEMVEQVGQERRVEMVGVVQGERFASWGRSLICRLRLMCAAGLTRAGTRVRRGEDFKLVRTLPLRTSRVR